MDAGWGPWWPSVFLFLAGLLLLVALAAVVLDRGLRTRRELRRWLASVRRSTARLRAGDLRPRSARNRDMATDVGRIAPIPTKGE